MRRQAKRLSEGYISTCISFIKRVEGIESVPFEDILDCMNFKIVLNYLSKGQLKSELDDILSDEKDYEEKAVYNDFGLLIKNNYSIFGFPQELVESLTEDDCEDELWPIINLETDSKRETLQKCICRTYDSLIFYSKEELPPEQIVFDVNEPLPFGPLHATSIQNKQNLAAFYKQNIAAESSFTESESYMSELSDSETSVSELSDSESDTFIDDCGKIDIECNGEKVSEGEPKIPEEVSGFIKKLGNIHYKQNIKIIYNKTQDEPEKAKVVIPVISQVVHSTIKDETPETLIKKQENLPSVIQNFHLMLISSMQQQNDDEVKNEIRKQLRAGYLDAKRRYFQYLSSKRKKKQRTPK